MTNSSGLAVTDVTSTSARLSWSAGSGNRRVVVGRAGAPITDFPQEGAAYVGAGEFGNGDNIGGSTYIVYEGAGSEVEVTGLDMGAEYHFRVFDYNESGNTGGYPLYKLCDSEGIKITAGVSTSLREAGMLAGVNVYPTVTSDLLTIDLPPAAGRVAYTILTTAGVPVLSGGLSGGRGRIEVAGLPRGAYLLRLQNTEGAGWVVRRFIRG